MHKRRLLMSAVLFCIACLPASTTMEAQSNDQQCVHRPLPGLLKDFVLATCCQCKGGGTCYCGRSSGYTDCKCTTACTIGETIKAYRTSRSAKAFSLESGLTVSGRLFDVQQHDQPLSGLEIRLVLPSGEVRRTHTDKTGRFRVLLEAVDPGTARLVENSDTMDLGSLFFDQQKVSNEQNYYFLAITPAEILPSSK